MKEVSVVIEGSSDFFYPDFLKDGSVRVGNQIVVSKDVFIRFDGAIFCESIDAPTFIQISVIVGRDAILPIALGIVSNWLYDKIKEKKAYKININGLRVELDKDKIADLLKQEIREKPSLKEHVFNLTILGIKNNELLMSARTLSDKPIVVNGIELPYPDNKVGFADYVSGKDVKIYLLIRDETLNAMFKKRINYYAKAESVLTPFKKTIFTKLVLNSERMPSSRKMQHIDT